MKVVELMNRLYDGELPLLPNDDDYRIALEEIEEQGIAGQVYYEIQSRGLQASIPSFFGRALTQNVEMYAVLNMVLKTEAERILALLEDRGIPTILLKGFWLSRRLYGNIGVRSTSDIDLLVPPEYFETACELIVGMAYESMPFDPNSPYHKEFVKDVPALKWTLQIELHWHLIRPYNAKMDCGPFWERAEPLHPYNSIFEFAAPDLLYSLCLHGANHGMSSVKHALDLVGVLTRYKDEIDINSLLERAKQEHTYGMVVMALSVTYRLFPHLRKLKGFDQCREWFPWDQRLAWRRETGFNRFGGGLSFYVQRTIFELAKLDRNQYRYRYLRKLLNPSLQSK